MRVHTALAAAVGLASGGCALPMKLPVQPPPLADMEVALGMAAEPEDEPQRRELPRGGFTGVYVTDERQSLDDLAGEAQGVLVSRVVENSPADAAGLAVGDLLLSVTPPGAAAVALRWPSQWRQVELDAAPGTVLAVVYDRAGVTRQAEVVVEQRLHAPGRHDVEQYREEQRVGVIVRTATEVEAREAGLGPGGGAVIVGLSRNSPWRTVGLQFGDVIVEAGGRPISHPQVLLDVIREATGPIPITYERNGQRHTVDAPLSRRVQETREVGIPLIYTYQNDRGVKETSILLGIFGLKETPAAWECTILWLIKFSGGDADRLEEIRR